MKFRAQSSPTNRVLRLNREEKGRHEAIELANARRELVVSHELVFIARRLHSRIVINVAVEMRLKIPKAREKHPRDYEIAREEGKGIAPLGIDECGEEVLQVPPRLVVDIRFLNIHRSVLADHASHAAFTVRKSRK